MLKIYIKEKSTYFVGEVYIDDFFYCNCIVNRDKFGRFPYDFYHPYNLKPLKKALHITDSNNSLFDERGLCIHTGNSVHDSKGCVLLGYNPSLVDGSFDESLLVLSKYCYNKLITKYNKFHIDDVIFFEAKGGVKNE